MWVIRASGNVVSRNITVPPALRIAEVSGDDLPVVLRHRHRHDLIGAGEKGRNGRGNLFRSRVEFGEGQRLPGVGNLQGGEMRKLLGGAAEDLRKPPDPFLMRHVHEGVGRRTHPSGCTGRCPPAGPSPPPKGTAATPHRPAQAASQKSLSRKWLSNLFLFASGVYIPCFC